MQFQPWHKIPRYNRDIQITEKVDGTNAQLAFVPLDEPLLGPDPQPAATLNTLFGEIGLWVGSRKRWLQPGKTSDNFGFATWACYNAEDLYELLGEGRHYGEWYGIGIQRGYDLTERRFALFNTDYSEVTERFRDSGRLVNVDTVPVLYEGSMSQGAIDEAIAELAVDGSKAAPGYDNPEGIVIYHKAARTSFKITLHNDEAPKTLVAA